MQKGTHVGEVFELQSADPALEVTAQQGRRGSQIASSHLLPPTPTHVPTHLSLHSARRSVLTKKWTKIEMGNEEEEEEVERSIERRDHASLPLSSSKKRGATFFF